MRLFREDVLTARDRNWLGTVHLAQSIPAWLGASVAIALAACLLVYGFAGSYARKAHVAGVLQPVGGAVNMAAPVAGRIAELRVREGQSVALGDVVMVLDTDRAALSGNTREGIGGTAALVARELELRRDAMSGERAARISQTGLRNRAIHDRLQSLDGELGKLGEEIELQSRRRDLAQRNVKRYEDLVKSEFMSSAQLQAQQDALLDQEGRLNSLERSRLSLEGERSGLLAEQRQNDAELATTMAGSEREALLLKQEATENTARRTAVLTAPRAGVIGAMALGLGQWVQAGQNLASIQPSNTPLEAQLFAPSGAVGFIAVGQPVLLRYAAYPYQKFGLQSGRVKSVSDSGFAPDDLPRDLNAHIVQSSSEALYRVTVALDSQSIQTYTDRHPLRAGMALQADIAQDRRRIIEWILEPLFAAAKRS